MRIYFVLRSFVAIFAVEIKMKEKTMDSYIVSARKYRPMTFDSVVGQGALTTTLKKSIQKGHLAHAYLFCGPRGVGKTTCARIFAKVINCMSPSADGEACGVCESCMAFNEQRSLNIYELDAASNNGIEEIKNLIEQTRIPPQVGKYKVFIIDEVHMLSNAAFNAFLKTLEEPPHYVIFILATTEKHKLLPTILSRCQIYDFNRMTIKDTVAHLQKVAEQEGVTAEPDALAVIAEKADGGMRDALSIFDQVTAYCDGNITYKQTIANLNVLDYDYYFKLVDYFLDGKIPEVMMTFNEIINKGFEGSHFINGLNAHLRNLLMCRDESTTKLLDTNDDVRQRYTEQAKKCKPQFLYRAIRLCTDCDINYKLSQNKRLLVEITLIEVAQSAQDDGVSAGRRPAKILKPLFNRAAVKRQVTAAQPVVSTTASPDGRKNAPAQPAPAPTLPDLLGPNATFNEENVVCAVKLFSQTLPQGGMRTLLFNSTPRVVGEESFEIEVDNPAIEVQLRKHLPALKEYVKNALHMSSIQVTVKVVEFNPKAVLTKAQIYRKMKEKNPVLAILEKEMQLHL